MIFGASLERTGAGESLIDISTALTACIRGGAAHAAIIASSVFGMMSGSVAAYIAGIECPSPVNWVEPRVGCPLSG